MPENEVIEVVSDGLATSQALANAMTNLEINEYYIEASLAMAECEVDLAEELYCKYRAFREYDSRMDRLQHDYKRYKAQKICGMAMSNGDVIRGLGRDMYARLATVGMYNSGKTRDIIETQMGKVVDDTAPQLALGWREEVRLEDLTYYSYLKALNALTDRGSLYVATGAMANSLDNQLILAGKAAAAAEKSISAAMAGATRVATTLFENKDKLFDFFKGEPEVQKGSPQQNYTSQSWYDSGAGTGSGNQFANYGNYGGDLTYTPPPVPASEGAFVGGEGISTPGGIGGV